MALLVDIEQMTQDRYEDLVEYLQEAPIDISSVMYHDELYDLAYKSVMADLTAESEARYEESRLGSYDDED